MTNLEKFRQDHPEMSEFEIGLTVGGSCPSEFGYPENTDQYCTFKNSNCVGCWSQPYVEKNELRDVPKEGVENTGITLEMLDQALEKAKEWAKDEPETIVELPTIKDSGDRTQFETGAVRDLREGKGRCDLMPLEVAANWISEYDDDTDGVLWSIREFQKSRSTSHLYSALVHFDEKHWDNPYTMLLEVARQFEDGAKKYGESNWQKGIPVYCYIDSAVRHYLKWLRGDDDEPHDRAFVWNLMCCIWEVDYHKTTVEGVTAE